MDILKGLGNLRDNIYSKIRNFFSVAKLDPQTITEEDKTLIHELTTEISRMGQEYEETQSLLDLSRALEELNEEEMEINVSDEEKKKLQLERRTAHLSPISKTSSTPDPEFKTPTSPHRTRTLSAKSNSPSPTASQSRSRSKSFGSQASTLTDSQFNSSRAETLTASEIGSDQTTISEIDAEHLDTSLITKELQNELGDFSSILGEGEELHEAQRAFETYLAECLAAYPDRDPREVTRQAITDYATLLKFNMEEKKRREQEEEQRKKKKDEEEKKKEEITIVSNSQARAEAVSEALMGYAIALRTFIRGSVKDVEDYIQGIDQMMDIVRRIRINAVEETEALEFLSRAEAATEELEKVVQRGIAKDKKLRKSRGIAL